jgi:FdhD protein
MATGPLDDIPPALRPDHPLLGLGYAKLVARRDLVRLDGANATDGSAFVAEEVPVSLVYNMRPHVVMMASPADLEDFAVGFTLTEGIVASIAGITRIEVVAHAQGSSTSRRADAQPINSRAGTLTTHGLRLCGVESIQDAVRELKPVSRGPTFRRCAVAGGAELPRPRPESRNRHAAVWVLLKTPKSCKMSPRNALDKVMARRHVRVAIRLTDSWSPVARATTAQSGSAGVRLLPRLASDWARDPPAEARPHLSSALRGNTANVYAHGND